MCTKFYVFPALAIVVLGFTNGLTKSLAKNKIIRRLNRKMPKLFYADDNWDFSFTEAQNILKIFQDNKINHLHVCGGLGKCCNMQNPNYRRIGQLLGAISQGTKYCWQAWFSWWCKARMLNNTEWWCQNT